MWECRYFFESLISILWGTYLVLELLDHMVVLFSVFWESSTTSSKVATPVHIPTSSPMLVIFRRTRFQGCKERLSLLWGFCFFVFFPFRAAPRHMEAPRLGAESEPLPLAYTTATATPDLSLVCNLHHGSWQHWIFNPLREARDRTHNLMAASQIHFCWATTGTP